MFESKMKIMVVPVRTPEAKGQSASGLSLDSGVRTAILIKKI